MSDCVIRFGGSYCSNTPFIKGFSEYIKNFEGRSFIVVSAIPDIKSLISDSIANVLQSGDFEEEFEKQLQAFFTKETGGKATVPYLSTTEELVKLLKGIRLIGDYSEALKAEVLSFGEKLSAQILFYRLTKWVDVQLIQPEEIGLKVTPDYGNATYTGVEMEKVNRLNPNGVFLLPGSYGVTPQGKIARAGYAASDYTAAALAALVKAPKLILWGMEKEFFSADPQIVENPLRIKRLTYAEASELAYFDHYSLHPRIVEPLEAKHIPIHIVSAASNNIETLINTETYVAKQIVKSVAYSDDISILSLNGPGVGLKPGILAKVTNCLNDADINIKSVITAQVAINLILSKENGRRALELIRNLGFDSVQNIQFRDNVSLIGIIGHGLQQNFGILAKLLNAVAQNKVNVILSGSGSANLVSYIVVKDTDRDVCIHGIHRAFFNKATGKSNI
ncbi:hypothetical protein MNBD_BACTEROID01-2161 [hydrothermal vent metagenome]|uniref:aspartate kinase n=1 Tax=hydrothermal vent metagenome TaxID=652676 RepID=A0A3B0U2I3_9ZZZZ